MTSNHDPVFLSPLQLIKRRSHALSMDLWWLSLATIFGLAEVTSAAPGDFRSVCLRQDSRIERHIEILVCDRIQGGGATWRSGIRRCCSSSTRQMAQATKSRSRLMSAKKGQNVAVKSNSGHTTAANCIFVKKDSE